MIKMEESFKSDSCCEGFNSLHKLDLHIERQHKKIGRSKKKIFKCHLCGYEPSKGHSLTNHMRTHTGERPFKCHVTDCGLAFRNKSTLNAHMKQKHSNKRPFKCDFAGCLYAAKTTTGLPAHKNTRHSDDRPYACPNNECSFRSKWKSYIKRHVKCVHNGVKTFTCTKCDYKTAQRCHLERHMRRHSARRDFKCNHPQCTASFKHSSQLKRHLSQLHQENNIQCDRLGCGQYLSTMEALENHQKLHNPLGRPFKCPLCFKHFRTPQIMQEHCFVHTNEKPFQCGHCKYEASTRGKIKVHISSAHANIEFPFIVHLLADRECLQCKLTLSSAEFLIHSKSHEDPVTRT